MLMELLELKRLGISPQVGYRGVQKTAAIIRLGFRYLAIPRNNPISSGRCMSVFRNVLKEIKRNVRLVPKYAGIFQNSISNIPSGNLKVLITEKAVLKR